MLLLLLLCLKVGSAEINSLMTLTVGQQTERSSVKYAEKNPSWNECFQFLVDDPETCHVKFQVVRVFITQLIFQLFGLIRRGLHWLYL